MSSLYDILRESVPVILEGYLVGTVLFFIAVNLTYTILLILSLKEILFYMRHNSFSDYRILVQTELAPPISVLAPAFNEEPTVVESVKSLLKLNYGAFEVVVINDGSTDGTLRRLTETFHLHKSKQVFDPVLDSRPVRGIYRSRSPEYRGLVVVDKENGGKADALNAGINVASHGFLCAIDADSLLEEDSLQKVIKPFLEDDSVIAAGGIVRIANGCEISNGRVVSVGLSEKFLPLFQVVEYLRAFLSGRIAWQSFNALLIVSGAFGVFRRKELLEAGGFRHDTVGEDMELIVRLHRMMRERREPYRIAFVPDPVCWTEVPESLSALARQRNRWYRGLLDVFRFHGRMTFHPQYGVVGMAAMPAFLFIEVFGPIVEFFGYVTTVVMFALGGLKVELAVLFFIVALFYGILFSVGGVLLEEISFRRYPNPRHLALLLAVGVFENFGYRQLTVWWRMKALFDYLRGKGGWHKTTRTGFGPSAGKEERKGRDSNPRSREAGYRFSRPADSTTLAPFR